MYAFFVGIDIAKYKHQAAFIDVGGAKVASDLFFENTSEGFDLLSLVKTKTDRIDSFIIRFSRYITSVLLRAGNIPNKHLPPLLQNYFHAIMVKQVPYTPEILANSK